MGSRLSRQSSLEEESTEEPCAGRLEGGRGDFHLSSLLRHPQKLPGVLRKASPAPYVRRVGWLREIQATIREHKREHAVHILRLLRKVNAAGEPGPGTATSGAARAGSERRAGQATKGCGRRAPCRPGRGLRSPLARRCGAGSRGLQAPLLGGAGLQPPLGALFVLPFAAPCPGGAGAASLGPRRGRQKRLREATPALAPCHLPVSPPGREAPGRAAWGQRERGWEEGCAARRRGVQALAVPIHTPPCQSLGVLRIDAPQRKATAMPLPPHPITPTQPGWPRSVFGRTQSGFGEDLWDSLG